MGINEDGEMVYDGLVSTFVMGEGQMSLNFVDNVATFASIPNTLPDNGQPFSLNINFEMSGYSNNEGFIISLMMEVEKVQHPQWWT